MVGLCNYLLLISPGFTWGSGLRRVPRLHLGFGTISCLWHSAGLLTLGRVAGAWPGLGLLGNKKRWLKLVSVILFLRRIIPQIHHPMDRDPSR